MEKTKQMGYSVSFVINEKQHKVILLSKDEKDRYIKEENQFCFKEYSEYSGAMSKTSRKHLKVELNKKRMAFAIHSGFREVGKSGLWNLVVDDTKSIA